MNTAQASPNPFAPKGDLNDGRRWDLIQQNRPTVGGGVFSRPLPGGTSLVVDSRPAVASGTKHPWKLITKVITEPSAAVRITVWPAVVNGGMPWIDTDTYPLDLDPAPYLEVTVTSKVWLKTVWDCSISEEVFMYAGVLRTDELVVGASAAVPADSGNGTSVQTKYLQIGTVTAAGKVTAQPFMRSLSLKLCDAGTEDGNGEVTFREAG